jgi:hypothetical protein
MRQNCFWPVHMIGHILVMSTMMFASGCGRHEQTVPATSVRATNILPAQTVPVVSVHVTNILQAQSCITTNMTLRQVTDRLGNYSRERGSGILYYEYDLADGSAVLIHADGLDPTNKVLTVGFLHSTNEIPLWP